MSDMNVQHTGSSDVSDTSCNHGLTELWECHGNGGQAVKRSSRFRIEKHTRLLITTLHFNSISSDGVI